MLDINRNESVGDLQLAIKTKLQDLSTIYKMLFVALDQYNISHVIRGEILNVFHEDVEMLFLIDIEDSEKISLATTCIRELYTKY